MAEERRRVNRLIGRRVAGAVNLVMQAGKNGSRLKGLEAGPEPEYPLSPADQHTNDTQEEFVRRHLGFDADASDLGEYVPSQNQSHDEATGGKSDYVRFPSFWRVWMSKQTPEKLSALDYLAQRELERKVVAKARKRTRILVGGAFATSILVVRWFTDQVGWVVEKIPLMQAGWAWLRGALS